MELVYQYSHTHPIPNTPNSSLTNTRNRETLASYAKLENSHNNMQQPKLSIALSISLYFYSLFPISTIAATPLLIYNIKSAKMSPCSNRIVFHATIVVSIVRYAIHIVSCVKSFVSYWHIVSTYESYDTVCVSYESYHIVRYIDKYFKMRFFVKICTFIWILQIIRLVLNTKLLDYLI